MTDEKIQEYVRKCPYFGNPKTIDTVSFCKLEFNYNAICPSKKCICADVLYDKEVTE